MSVSERVAWGSTRTRIRTSTIGTSQVLLSLHKIGGTYIIVNTARFRVAKIRGYNLMTV